MSVFVDTGGFYALQVPNDRWHSTAVTVFKALAGRRRSLVTTNLVVGETFTLLRIRNGREAAWRFHDAILRSPSLVVAHVGDELEQSAWTLLRRYDDQAFSFVDGTSFAFMRRNKLSRAIAFDAHFAAAGMVRLGVDEKA